MLFVVFAETPGAPCDSYFRVIYIPADSTCKAAFSLAPQIYRCYRLLIFIFSFTKFYRFIKLYLMRALSRIS